MVVKLEKEETTSSLSQSNSDVWTPQNKLLTKVAPPDGVSKQTSRNVKHTSTNRSPIRSNSMSRSPKLQPKHNSNQPTTTIEVKTKAKTPAAEPVKQAKMDSPDEKNDLGKEVNDKELSESSRDDETRYETEVSSVTSSEWDVNEMTSKSIKEAELLEDALTKKLESQLNENDKATKPAENGGVNTRTFTKKVVGRSRPVSSPAFSSPNQESGRPAKVRPRTTAKIAPANNIAKVQTTKLAAGSLAKVTKESTNQRRSYRSTPPRSK